MNRVLLSNAYFYPLDPKQWKDQRPYPPYGTIYAAALLREAEFEVSLFDTNLRRDPADIQPILDAAPDAFVIYDDGFNYLSKMCLTQMRDAVFAMIRYARPIVKNIFVCSSDSTDHYQQYLDAGADFVLLGEGEMTLLELLAQIRNKETNFEEIQGIAYTFDGQTITTPRRSVLKDLDQLPDPAWDLVDIQAYKNIWVNKWGYFSLNIATTRGCPFKCNWCAKPIYGNRYNSRSPGRVAREMAMLIQEFDAEHFWVCDDIFGLKPGWVQEFREELKALGISPRYKIQSRADLLLKEDTIDALAESGLDTVWIGAESGSQKILDAMDKGTKVSQIYESTRLLKAKGVKVGFFLQFGYLGETEKEIHQTIQMVLDLMPDDIGISVSYPLPGTKFFEIVAEQMDQKQNWTDSDDLAMMYQGTYSSAFYRRLHRYVHKKFRLKQGWEYFRSLLKNPSGVKKQQIRSVLATLYYLPAVLIDGFLLQRLKSKVNNKI